MELCICVAAMNLGLFRHLEQAKDTLTTEQLSKLTSADKALLGRICRYLASAHIVTQTDHEAFQATEASNALASPQYEAGLRHHFYLLNKPLQRLPDFLHDKRYQDNGDPSHTAFSKALDTELKPLEWLNEHPAERRDAFEFSAAYAEGRPQWPSAVQLIEDLRSWEVGSERPLFVDVGGGFGSETVEFQKVMGAYFDGLKIPGRLILQDIEPTIKAAPDHPGIEKQAVDFLVEQPIKGAKFYFLRHILHRYQDEVLLKIVGHIKEAMVSDSVIIINELVIPDLGTPKQAAQQDLMMLTCYGSAERTEKQWRYMLEDQCNLSITINTYDKITSDSIIECTLR